MKKLFSIGEVACQQNVSRQTLLFYDRIGLFRPAYVDPDNGYRYYSAEQLEYLDTICIMKRIGFSLEDIRTHMQSYDLEQSVTALRRQLAEIERQLRELQLIHSRVAHRCTQLERAAALRVQSPSVTVETAREQYLLIQSVRAPYGLDETSIATKECFVRSFREQLPIFFQSGAIIPYANIVAGRYTEASFAFLPIEKTEAVEGVVMLPAGRCVCTYHTGDYLSVGSSYERLLAYCAENRLHIRSDSYEFAINDALSTGNTQEYITKLMFYIE